MTVKATSSSRIFTFEARLALVALGAVVFAAPSFAEVVVGTATVLDGDTLEVMGKRVRLSGIDAPELDQTCDRNGSRWGCGQAAKAQLSSMVSGKQVRCRGEERDVYTRLIAVCTVGYLELNKALVEDGWAVVYGDNRGAYLA